MSLDETTKTFNSNFLKVDTEIEQILDEHGIPRTEAISTVRRWSMACPAMPTFISKEKLNHSYSTGQKFIDLINKIPVLEKSEGRKKYRNDECWGMM